MKLLLTILTLLISFGLSAQSLCFYNPNEGAIYHNGSSGAIYDVTYGDFNSDDHVDIVTANSEAANISFIPGYGDGSLGSADTISLSGILFCIASADLDGDGQLDIVTANNTTAFVLLGNGDGTFQPADSYEAGGSPSRVYCKDINNDNIPDIVEACGDGIFVLLGSGDGSFAPATGYLSGLAANDVAIADFDNDSVLDIVSTTHLTLTNSELSFLKGNGDGTFAPSSSILSITYPDNFIAGITSMDIDGDGHADLMVANSGNSIKRVEIYFGNGNGTFGDPVFYSTHSRPFYIYLTDADNDLIEDIVVEEGNGFTVLTGNSDGTFDPYEHFPSVSTPNSLAIEDFNEDGQMDIISPSAYFGSPLIAVNLNCSETTGVDSHFQDENESVTIFPNPFSTHTNIEFSNSINDGEVELYIYDVEGRKARVLKHFSGRKVELSRDNLPGGIYFIQLMQNNKTIATEKLIIMD
ncbi:T9SS type A sorting domain-containing protein [Halocola ammonii]